MDKHLKRQLELAGLLTENKQTKLPSMELIKEGRDGITYAVVRENKKYFIKTAETKENLTEHDFDFLHGLPNKGRNTFRSYEDATFKLNLIFEDINRTYDGDETNILEDDILGEKRYVLKQPKPKVKEPEMDFGDDEGGDDFNFGDEEGDEDGEDFDFGDEGGDEGDEFDFGDEGSDEDGEDFDFGDEGSDEDGEDFDFGDDGGNDEEFGGEFEDNDVETGDTIKDIQKLTGKLGQQIRDTEDLSSDMQKWVAKSVMSALKPETLDSSDKEDIINTINKGGDVDEVVLGVDIEPNDPTLTGPGGGEIEEPPFNQDWGLPKYDDVSENDEDNERAKAIAKQHGDYQDGDDISAISGALAMDREMNEDDEEYTRGGETHDPDELLFSSEEMYGRHHTEDSLQREDDGVLRAADLPSSDDDYHEPDPRLSNQGGEPWSLPKHGNDPTVSRRSMYRESIMREDHLNDEMNNSNQLDSYLDVEGMIRGYGFSLGFCHKEGSVVYLDLKDGEEKLAKIKIDSDGSMEVGYMEGEEFMGEPLDNVGDIDEFLGVEQNIEEDMELNNPAPAKPTTKPGIAPSEDNPWAPTPTEDPDPKARDERGNDAPAPAKPKTRPGTKPSEDNPWAPTPTEDPDPKARRKSRFDEDNDVEFE
jgi:hypothetical protein